jgi:hypothetical protein
MKIGQLKKVLAVAARYYRDGGNHDVARDLTALATNLLKDRDTETVGAFVKRVEAARKPRTKSPKRKSR